MARLRKIQAHYSEEPIELRRQTQELERVVQDYAVDADREIEDLRAQVEDLTQRLSNLEAFHP